MCSFVVEVVQHEKRNEGMLHGSFSYCRTLTANEFRNKKTYVQAQGVT